MKNGSAKLIWSVVVPVVLYVFVFGCEATVNTGPVAGASEAPIQPGAVGQDTYVDPTTTAGTIGGGGTEVTPGQTPVQPTGQTDAQVVAQRDAQVVTPPGGGTGGSTPPQPMVDSGTPDGNTGTVTPPQPEASTPVTPPQPVGDGQTCLKPGDGSYTLASGPYGVTRMDNIELVSLLPAGTPAPTTYSIWHPEPLEANCPHPIVAWGNGTTVTGPDVYDFFNRNAAAWGIVVIGSNNSNVGSGAYHKAGIDYLLKQNQDPSSKFYQKLSDRAGTSGHSQGGMGATAASNHPNVFAEVSVAGGGFVDAKVAIICLTGTEDFVAGPCMSSVNGAAGPGFIASWQGGDHVVTETLAGYITGDPGSLAMQRLYAAWFRCFLADDPVACAMFKGNPCGICNEPGWAQIENRNM